MVSVDFQSSVCLPDSGLWLDPLTPRPLAFVSHAHSDHVGRHEHIICTSPTARLMTARMGGEFPGIETLEYGVRRGFGSWTATLYPAGHVLGSAQLFYESGEGTLLYTGDFKLRPGLSSEGVTALHAETLVMETTYGLPRYQFPPVEETLSAVLKFCIEAIEDGEIPVLLGYALGKAQEILSRLQGAGLPIMLHPAVESVARVYEEFGVCFPPYGRLDPDAAQGHVLICPPGTQGSRLLRRLPSCRIAALTGWAIDPGAVHRMQVDAAFPLSDHAGYDDLLRLVEMVNPARVLTLHGFAREFAADLRTRGWEAWALTGANQLEFSMREMRERVSPQSPDPLPDMDFGRFCRMAETIRQTAGKLEKIRLLAGYLRSLTSVELPLAVTWLTGRAFPNCDDQPLQVGGAVIFRALAAAAGLSSAELRVIARRHNDAGLTAMEALLHRPGNDVPALVAVGELLRALRVAKGPLAKAEMLTAAFRQFSPLVAAYLVRILTGDLRIGLKEGLLEEAIASAFSVESADVREANMLLGDVGRTAELARDRRLDEAEMSVFQPVKSMLASPEPDAGAIWKRLGANGSVWLEDKLDGIRAQIHVTPERVEIYSRDLKRMTETFPEICAAALRLRREAVFDGEILAWDHGAPMSFFELQKRLGRRDADLFLPAEIPVSYLIFDLLELDGRSLLKKPLIERRSLLERLPLVENLQLAPVFTVRSGEEIEEAFRAARQRGNEGLMAKDPTSLYSPGRRGLSWLKLKKEFATLDVVVVAAEYGHGRRSKVLSDYTFAVLDEERGEFLTVGKAYSGLTDVEIEELTEEFLRLVISRQGNRLKVEPRIVLEVAFDSIQPSDRHSSGLALRFPRIKQIRRDKSPREIDTLAAARALAGLDGRSG